MNRDRRIVAAVLGSIATVIGGGSILCSFLIAEGASPRWRLAFRLFCHGIAERSLSVFGEAMPICARCFGIYAGVLIGVIAFASWPYLRERTARWMMLFATMPILIDGGTQALGLRLSNNPLRVTTGILAAVAFTFWALAVVQQRDEAAVRTS